MNLFQHYKRVQHLSKNTSRRTNPDWYKNALDLNAQIHLYLREGQGLEGYLFIKEENHYEKLGLIPISAVEDEEMIDSFIGEILQIEKLKKNKSLGVILYVSDELSIASLGPEHRDPADLPELRATIIHSPGEVLEDKTVSADDHSWRLFPYAGAVAGSEFSTAVMLSRKFSKTMKLFREVGRAKNLPIVTSVLSAPLCAVASLPWFSSENKNGTIAVYNYARFTLLAFFDKAGELMMMRNMAHPSGATFPKNIGTALMVTANAFELENPDINVLSPVDNDTTEMVAKIQKARPQSDSNSPLLVTTRIPSMEQMKEMEAMEKSSEDINSMMMTTRIPSMEKMKEMEANSEAARPLMITTRIPSMEQMKKMEAAGQSGDTTAAKADLKFVDFHEIVKKNNAPEEIPLEIVVATQPYDVHSSSIASNKTFTDLSENGWHLQEFLLPSAEEQGMYPSEGDMKVLRISRAAKLVASVAVIGFVALQGFGIWNQIKSEEWNYAAENTEVVKAGLQRDVAKYSDFDNILQDRSKAWANMELISQLVGEDGLVELSSVNHQVVQERDDKTKQSGFKKTWIVKGFTTEQGLEYLDTLSTRDEIANLFQQVAKVTGNAAYLTDVPQRDLLVNLTNSNNRGYQAGEKRDRTKMHPLSFTMNITQTLSASDPLALKLK